MKVAVGCDHGGIVLKDEIMTFLKDNGYEVIDFGTDSTKSVDYPDYGLKVAEAVKDGIADRGIVMCGTGIGIGITANKVPGIRCAMVSDVYSAQMTREHNDANMIALGGRTLGPGLAVTIVEKFLTTEFSHGERHQNRINKIAEVEKKYSK
ncbi:MAG: ribose 5-phosphate isomerase B [Clostridia bacterium]|jgi:ribose 5-phosphate isomerase B|nr:ribose 5-phosphate isomerase B [Clostridia bacterium]